VGWTGHVAYIGEMKRHKIFWLGSVKGGDHSEVSYIDGRIILMGNH
jgi:hypothetical protein